VKRDLKDWWRDVRGVGEVCKLGFITPLTATCEGPTALPHRL
jgi:hypothetical protein